MSKAMERIYNEFKGTPVVYPKYTGIVCGFTDSHLILAVETKETSGFFRVLKKDFFVEEPFKEAKFRYVFEDERVVEKQFEQWQQNQKKKSKD